MVRAMLDANDFNGLSNNSVYYATIQLPVLVWGEAAETRGSVSGNLTTRKRVGKFNHAEACRIIEYAVNPSIWRPVWLTPLSLHQSDSIVTVFQACSICNPANVSLIVLGKIYYEN